MTRNEKGVWIFERLFECNQTSRKQFASAATFIFSLGQAMSARRVDRMVAQSKIRDAESGKHRLLSHAMPRSFRPISETHKNREIGWMVLRSVVKMID